MARKPQAKLPPSRVRGLDEQIAVQVQTEVGGLTAADIAFVPSEESELAPGNVAQKLEELEDLALLGGGGAVGSGEFAFDDGDATASGTFIFNDGGA